MSKFKKLEGLVIALPTPLYENENVDIPSLLKLLDYCIGEGAKAIMILGTMGEGAALLDSQRIAVVENTVAHTAGRVPILATVSDVSTRKTLEFAKAINTSQVDYVVCTSPFYYKFPDPKSVLRHINTIADTVAAPLIFYNAPGMTGNPVDVDTIDKILNMERIAGIKDSSCNYNNFVELLRRYPDKNNRPGTIMQGDESVFDSSLLMGADGMVSGGGVVFIQALVELYKAGVSNDKAGAMELQRKFTKDLLGLLGPNLSRDWVFNIKRRLVEMDIIVSPTVTSPFLTS